VLKIGVIGCGDIAGKRDLPKMHQPDRGVALEAVCDIVPERAEEAASKFGAAHHYRDYREMVEEADISQVVILTPLFTHAGIVRDCLEGGKHVYTEKPLARTRGEAQELLDLAKGKGLLLTAAPLRTETRSGSSGSPNRNPMSCSSFFRLASISSASPGGQALPCWGSSEHTSALMVKPGGTGIPMLVISARLAPLPPRMFFMVVFPSALPPPKK